MVTADPPTHMSRNGNAGGLYRNVMLNRRQVEQAWPRKILWGRLRKKSSAQRPDLRLSLPKSQTVDSSPRFAHRNDGSTMLSGCARRSSH